MRSIPVDQSRRRNAKKRGGGARLVLPRAIDAVEIASPRTLLALDEALIQRRAADTRMHPVAMLGFFAGLGEEHLAEILGESARTLRSKLTCARTWLHRSMRGRI